MKNVNVRIRIPFQYFPSNSLDFVVMRFSLNLFIGDLDSSMIDGECKGIKSTPGPLISIKRSRNETDTVTDPAVIDAEGLH